MPPMQSDLVKDSRLEINIFEDYTQHVFWTRGAAPGRRKRRTEERWKRCKLIGAGAFGQVWLEACEGDDESKLRAIKIIQKKPPGEHSVDCATELEAIAKFSHEKVSCNSV